jgi:hypothetical protein
MKTKSKHCSQAKMLKARSERYKKSLKRSAKKFYNEDVILTKFSSVMFAKDKSLHIVNGRTIKGLNTGFNSYTQIEKACSMLSGTHSEGAFYLNNTYPVMPVGRSIKGPMQSTALIKFDSKKKLSKHNGLMMQYFS